MTEESLRAILRDPSYPRELRFNAYCALVKQQRVGFLLYCADRDAQVLFDIYPRGAVLP